MRAPHSSAGSTAVCLGILQCRTSATGFLPKASIHTDVQTGLPMLTKIPSGCRATQQSLQTPMSISSLPTTRRHDVDKRGCAKESRNNHIECSILKSVKGSEFSLK